jgi:hypothetical protein
MLAHELLTGGSLPELLARVAIAERSIVAARSGTW